MENNKKDTFRSIPTIKDVAIAAGVSLKTVSRVINNSDNVRPETREKVLAAIKAIGYQPNAIARSLRVKKTYTIGVIIADITNSFYSAIVRGIEDVAVSKNYSVLIANSDEVLKKEKLYARVFVEKQVEGMIIVPASGSQKYLENLAGHLPLVFVDRYPEGISAPVVKVENEKGAYDLTSHLLDHGYEEIAFIGYEPALTTAQERFAGFQKALQERGLKPRPELIKTGNKTVLDAYHATEEVLKQPRRPQAIFAANNFMMQGALRALNHAGLEVPRDVAVVGFDDFEMADAFRPRLTVVSQPAYTIGREAACLLFSKMENRSGGAEAVVLPTELIIRESCGCLRRKLEHELRFR
ncbi:transcriptional regulator, LacI family [Thermanaeromonas toyohensis ToBE]|uniref:Transcriptional regulator, LacI family n=1 Tax=Thermanaeromonas toyohensis ToBE TaxID=698762 RepID=A0A1W1VC19_9FIRM|nr:LacI family DNA-binding transcriptional regulator [Thermanaeromonas toyohensis]SMB90865.1 transcriptional regulator, LacI family [Thermanaeromonas toyohensis ToBE]